MKSQVKALLRPRRDARTVFVEPWPYWGVNAVRHWGLDVGVLALAAAAGVWWSRGPGGVDLRLTDNDSADSFQRTLLAHDVSRYYPTLVGLILCLILLRTGRGDRGSKNSRLTGAIYRSLTVGTLMLEALFPLIDAYFVPGSLVQRFAPCAAGAALACVARWVVYGSIGGQAATEGGFRPPRSTWWRPRTRRLVRRTVYVDLGTQDAAERAAAAFAAAAAEFGRRGSRAGVAWCVAAEVDYHLHISALDRAEELLEQVSGGAVAAAAGRDGRLAAEPAVAAAHAFFLQAVGDVVGARQRLDEAVDALRAKGRRVPARLAAQRAAAHALGPGGTGVDETGWAQLARLVWFRQPSLVLRHVLVRARRLSDRDPDDALVLATRMIWLAEVLPERAFFSDLSSHEASLLLRTRAEFCELAGELNARLHRTGDAAHWYLVAARLYQSRRYRAPEAVALVRAALAALAGADPADGRESDHLDLLLRGLRMLEYDRGLLRERRNRSTIAGDRDRLYADVFASLAREVRRERRRAAEIALWLMESLHRSATAATVRRGLDAATNPALQDLRRRYEEAELAAAQALAPTGSEQNDRPTDEEAAAQDRWARLRADVSAEFSRQLAEALAPDPVNLGDIGERLGGRLALYYRCERTADAWCVTCVALLPDGPHLTRRVLPLPAVDDPSASFRLHPALLLDTLHRGGHDAVARVHRTAVLSARVWQELSEALLPGALQRELERSADAADPPVVVIVPDGPLSAVPFAGLPLAAGVPLIERAVPVWTPSLDMLADEATPSGEVDEAKPSGEVREPARILANIGQPGFADAFARALDSLPGRPYVRHTAGREDFVDGLPMLSRDDVAVVFHHGLPAGSSLGQHVRMNDERILSATTAWSLRWPRHVILGSCWSSSVTVATGEEPLAMATACLLGGAGDVLGAQAPAYTREAGRLLAETTVVTAHGMHPAVALRSAVRALRAAGQAWPPPANWANLAVWTTQPPPAPSGARANPRAWRTAWNLAQSRAGGLFSLHRTPSVEDLLSPIPDYDPNREGTFKTSTSMRRVLRQARDAYGDVPFTTTEFLTAMLAADAEGWAAFLAGAGLVGRPPHDTGESTIRGNTVTWRDGESFAFNEPLSVAWDLAKRLADYRGDSEIQPAHVVYGLIADQESAAARWLASGRTGSAAGLRDLLARLIMPSFLPDPATLPPRPQRRPASPTPVPVGLLRGHDRLVVDESLLAVVEAASAERDGAVVTTTAFLRAAVRDDPDVQAHFGIAVGAPGQEKGSRTPARRGGRGLALTPDRVVTVSPRMALAYETAQSLCFRLGHKRVTTAHVAAAVLAVEGSGGAQWARTRSAAPATASFTAAVSALFFGAEVEYPLRKTREEDVVFGPVRDAVLLAGMVAAAVLGWCAKRGGRLVLGFALLAAIAVTASLHSAYTAPPNDRTLMVAADTVTAELWTSDSARYPAVLLSPLSALYSTPAVLGKANMLKATLWPKTPHALDDWYAFAVPVPEHGPRDGAARLTYKGRSVPALVHCAGAMGNVFCVAEARLTGHAAPGGFRWFFTSLSFHGADPASVLLLTRTGEAVRVDAGSLRPVRMHRGDVSADVLVVRNDAGRPLDGLTPVVNVGHSHQLPFLGLAEPAGAGQPTKVISPDLLNLYAGGVADTRAGSVPGAVASAGLNFPGADGSDPLAVLPVPGGPADLAGIRLGDSVVDVAGTSVGSVRSVQAAVRAHRPGDRVRITVRRADRLLTMTVALGYLHA
ncbi:CHAT domain-containing protein [Streptomyces sp. NPDC046985]|uniref:CHAT domain-containing protein n=1 Tax=Streptomyces sp. NPDC046985 TaxID=3155377 RepID=UPI00340D30BF